MFERKRVEDSDVNVVCFAVTEPETLCKHCYFVCEFEIVANDAFAAAEKAIVQMFHLYKTYLYACVRM